MSNCVVSTWLEVSVSFSSMNLKTRTNRLTVYLLSFPYISILRHPLRVVPWNQRCVSLALPSPTCIVWSGTGLNGSICWPSHEALPRHTFTSHSTTPSDLLPALPFIDFRLRPSDWSYHLLVDYTRLITWTSWPISRSHYPKQPSLPVIAS